MRPINEYLISKNTKSKESDSLDDFLSLLYSEAKDNREKQDHIARFYAWVKHYDRTFVDALCEKINEFVDYNTDVIIGYNQVRPKTDKTFYITAVEDSEFKMTIFAFYNHSALEALKVIFEPDEINVYFYHKDDKYDWQGWLKNEWWPPEIFINNGYHSESIDDFKKALDRI